MPLITLTTAKSAMAGMNNNTNYSGARQASSSNYSTVNTNSTNIKAVEFFRSAGRGSATFRFARAFFAYDFTGYETADGTMTNLKWNFRGGSGSNSNVITRLVKTSAFGSGVGSNYANSDWWNSLTLGTTYNPSSGANATWNSGTSDQSWTLSSNAITAAQTDGFLKFAAMNSLWDYSGNMPALDVYQVSNINNSISGLYTRANITFDWVPAATGYKNSVNGVLPEDIKKVNTVSTLTIENIMGVN
tara:strand:+ start:1212 stop:1949 length:738 start_codon:yes stop_codon:yes gene_type:complete